MVIDPSRQARGSRTPKHWCSDRGPRRAAEPSLSIAFSLGRHPWLGRTLYTTAQGHTCAHAVHTHMQTHSTRVCTNRHMHICTHSTHMQDMNTQHTHMHTHMCTYTCTHSTCAQRHAHTVHTCTHRCTATCTTNMHMHMHIYAHAHIYTCKRRKDFNSFTKQLTCRVAFPPAFPLLCNSVFL